MSKYFEYYNANPFGREDVGDCAIRAVSSALGMSYKTVCRKMKGGFKEGYGLESDGVDLYQLQEIFSRYFDKVENDYEDPNEDVPEEFRGFVDPFRGDDDDDDADMFYKDKSNNLSLGEWMEVYRGTGRFLVGCMDPKEYDSGHIVYVDTNKMKFYDTGDVSRFKVDSFMRVKDTLKESNESGHPLIKVALIVHNKPNNYLDRIMAGTKKMETRALSSGKKIQKLMLKYGPIDEQGIAFIDDNHKIIGWAEVEEIKLYSSAEEFYADSDLHGITPDDTAYGYDEKKGKAGILFKGTPHKLKTPISVDKQIRQRMSGYVDTTGYEEDEIYQLAFDS